MRKIKTLKIENFQSHENLTLDFNENLNVILGPSDSGKSAIIRALKWALFNEPAGDFFIRKGSNHAKVSIIFENDDCLVRGRSSSRNYYELHHDGKTTILEGFGVGLPEEVIQFTKIRKIGLDEGNESCINISDQLEGPFLLSEKSSTRANAIGRLSGVHIIDYASNQTNRALKKEKSSTKFQQERIDQLKEELKNFDYLKSLKSEIEQLEISRLAIHNKKKNLSRIIEISEQYARLNKSSMHLTIQLQKLHWLEQVEILSEKISIALNKYVQLTRIYMLLSDIEKRISSLTTIIDKTKHLEDLKSKVNHIEKNLSQYTLCIRAYDFREYYRESKENYLKFDVIPIEEIENKRYRASENLFLLHNLKKLYIALSAINHRFNISEKYVPLYSHLDEIKFLKENLEHKIKLRHNLQELEKNFNLIELEKTKLIKILRKTQDREDKNIQQYAQILLKQGKCPYCNQTIDQEHLEHLINDIKGA